MDKFKARYFSKRQSLILVPWAAWDEANAARSLEGHAVKGGSTGSVDELLLWLADFYDQVGTSTASHTLTLTLILTRIGQTGPRHPVGGAAMVCRCLPHGAPTPRPHDANEGTRGSRTTPCCSC